MKWPTLGLSGLQVSLVGLGCNNFGGWKASLDLEGARKVVHKALEVGITLFDTSDSYGIKGGSEITLGETLGPNRKDIVLATKFASPMNREKSTRYNGSRGYIMKAVEDSLERLKTDWIDLYQYHFPDPLTPVEETLRALDDLVKSGKVRYIGCSNLTAWQLVDAAWASHHFGLNRFISTQSELSLLSRAAETEILPALEAKGMSLLPYFPLASGMLTGKYRKGKELPPDARLSPGSPFSARLTDEKLDIVEKLVVFAEARGHSLLELSMSWLAAKPQVASIIAGATKPEQIDANVAAVGWKFTTDELGEIDRITAT
jgi:aryl-alcohol dehydrogenase-like predicted oxidoreductase